MTILVRPGNGLPEIVLVQATTQKLLQRGAQGRPIDEGRTQVVVAPFLESLAYSLELANFLCTAPVDFLSVAMRFTDIVDALFDHGYVVDNAVVLATGRCSRSTP